ncbi:MAG: flagellar hook-associated protein FlgK [Acidobacteria bacterium]|nr:flagellar hook-associated protein FlgK [Acidobacteriota bacterium]
MGGIFTSLVTATNTLKAFERGLAVSQNNVSNASTPNFATQRPTFEALRFEPSVGILGGVANGPLASSRSTYAEGSVWRQNQLKNYYEQQRTNLEAIQPVFDIRDATGVSGAINQLFQSVSQWSVSPNDRSSRELVLARAANVASSFRGTASQLKQAQGNTDTQIRNLVDGINAIGARVAKINSERRANFGSGRDPGSDAVLYKTLEELSGLTNFTTIEQEDGSITVFLGGQTTFAIGDRLYPIQADLSSGTAKIINASKDDITNQLTSGKLPALIAFRDKALNGYQTQLDVLASSFADIVNTGLARGVDQAGASPRTALYTYDLSAAAATIDMTDLTAAELAGASPDAPGGNGNVLELAKLGTAKVLDGQSFIDYYATLSSQQGRDVESARTAEKTHDELLGQAMTYREEVSAVSLDAEAASILQFQRSYQAAAQIFKVVNDMAETLIGILR